MPRSLSHAEVKLDANHREIVEALRGVGALVFELALYGCPIDLLIRFRGRYYLVDLKSEGGKLTATQEAMRAAGWPVQFWSSPEQALRQIGAIG